MSLSLKTIRVLLAVALGLGCSAAATASYAQAPAMGAPTVVGTPTMGMSTGFPSTSMGTTSQSMNSSAQPSATNQTNMKTNTGKQPTLIGSAMQLSVLATTGTMPSDLGFIGADSLNRDYFNSNSLMGAQGVAGSPRVNNGATNRNAATTGRGAAAQTRQTRAQGQQRNNTTNGANGASGQTAKSGVRAALRSEISVRPQAVFAHTAQFQSRLSRLPALQRYNDQVQVSVAGRTATLRGKVSSKREAEMLAKLALMEAGISAVDNQLVVLTADAR